MSTIFQPAENKNNDGKLQIGGLFKHLKCVLVGDNSTDKTKLVIKYTLGEDNTCRTDRGTPDAIENYTANVKIDKIYVTIDLWDVADNDKAQAVRTLCYPGTHIFLIFFNCSEPKSVQSLKQKWSREILKHSPLSPWVLVGTHAEVRDQIVSSKTHVPVITKEQGEKLAAELGAPAYIEVKQNESSKPVFERAIRVALNEQFAGMKARQRYVDSIIEESKATLEDLNKQINLAVWRGDSQQEAQNIELISKVREEIQVWEGIQKEVVKAAKEDPTEQGSDFNCTIQ
eukprot:c19454_g1_i1.p1 GENE.c19454_g1_i1~~c19454_g1_i1.p1  ORF type:complete len:306 (+),score=136.10 c19454_g1_i1:61-918(+)